VQSYKQGTGYQTYCIIMIQMTMSDQQ